MESHCDLEIGPETAEEIGVKGKKCPRLPVSILSLFTPRVSGGCNSFDMVCVCVCVSVCLTTLAEWTDIQT